MSSKPRTIEIEDAGPIKHVSIPIPESGIVVLSARNGTGKSAALEAIEALVSKTGRITTRDGAARAEVSAFGATLRVGRRLSRLGELEIESLEGFSINDIVDPKIKDPEAADAKRIKALIQLTGSPANAMYFYYLLGGQEEFDKYVPSDVLNTDDLVSMQASIKRALEKAARQAEESAKRYFLQAQADRIAAGDIDITQPDDSDLLSAAFEDAAQEEARLKAEAKSAREANDKAEAARAKQAAMVYDGPSLEEAELRLDQAGVDVSTAVDKVEQLKLMLVHLEKELEQEKHAFELCKADYKASLQHETDMSMLQLVINAGETELISEQALSDAAERLMTSRTALEQGALVRKAKEDLDRAAKTKVQATEFELAAATLREAAHSSEGVLTAAVQSLGVPLAVHNNRLIATGTERGAEVFDDLSDGEKWKLVTSIAVKAVGPGGIIVLPQNAWQDLDPINRQIVGQEVANTKVIVITAEASADEEITSTVYDPFPLVE